MSSEIVVPETPNWLQELEAKREKRLKARLGHEAGAGAPCLKCEDKCPGLDLHFWRKCCKVCKCSKEEHEVQDDDIYGWAQFQLLGSKPSKSKQKIVLPGKRDEIILDWTPKGNKETVDKYLKTLSAEQLPVSGSQAARDRKQLLQKQIPIHDIDPNLCHELNEEELKQMNEYIAHVKQNSVGVGQIVSLSSIIKGNLHMLSPADAEIIAKRYAKGVPLLEIVRLQSQRMAESLKHSELSEGLEKLSLKSKGLPSYDPEALNQVEESERASSAVVGRIHDKTYLAYGVEDGVEDATATQISSGSVPDRDVAEKYPPNPNFDPTKRPSQFNPQFLPYQPPNRQNLAFGDPNLEYQAGNSAFVPYKKSSEASTDVTGDRVYENVDDLRKRAANLPSYLPGKYNVVAEHQTPLAVPRTFKDLAFSTHEPRADFQYGQYRQPGSYPAMNDPEDSGFKPIRTANNSVGAYSSLPTTSSQGLTGGQATGKMSDQGKGYSNLPAGWQKLGNDASSPSFLADQSRSHSNLPGEHDLRPYWDQTVTYPQGVYGLTPNWDKNVTNSQGNHTLRPNWDKNSTNPQGNSDLGTNWDKNSTNPQGNNYLRSNWDQTATNPHGSTPNWDQNVTNPQGVHGLTPNWDKNATIPHGLTANWDQNVTNSQAIQDLRPNWDKNSTNPQGNNDLRTNGDKNSTNPQGNNDLRPNWDKNSTNPQGNNNLRPNWDKQSTNPQGNNDLRSNGEQNATNPQSIHGLRPNWDQTAMNPHGSTPNRDKNSTNPQSIHGLTPNWGQNVTNPQGINDLRPNRDSITATSQGVDKKHTGKLSEMLPSKQAPSEDFLYPNQVNIGLIQDISYPEIKAALQGTNDFYEDYSPDSIREIINNIKLPDCHYCKKPFEENEFAVAIDRAKVLFHAECFKCAGCNQILADNVYFYHKETDNIYCLRDYAKIRGFPRCKACDELIFTKEYCLADNSTFHLKHFCCTECDKPLAGQDYTLEEEMPYCLPCFEQSKASKCSSCCRVIKPDEMGCTLNGVHFHAVDECFACQVCKKPLMGKKLLLKSERLFCSHECHQAAR